MEVVIMKDTKIWASAHGIIDVKKEQSLDVTDREAEVLFYSGVALSPEVYKHLKESEATAAKIAKEKEEKAKAEAEAKAKKEVEEAEAKKKADSEKNIDEKTTETKDIKPAGKVKK